MPNTSFAGSTWTTFTIGQPPEAVLEEAPEPVPETGDAPPETEDAVPTVEETVSARANDRRGTASAAGSAHLVIGHNLIMAFA